jgi:hypothetical protein
MATGSRPSIFISNIPKPFILSAPAAWQWKKRSNRGLIHGKLSQLYKQYHTMMNGTIF